MRRSPSSTSTSGSIEKQPAAAGTNHGRASRRECFRDLVGAQRDGVHVARDEDPRHAATLAAMRASLAASTRATGTPSTSAAETGGAEAEAVDRFQRYPAVRRGAAHRHAQPLGRSRLDRGPAARLASLGPTDLDDMLAGRLVAEVVVEGDDAVDVRTADVQRLRDLRHQIGRNEADRALDRMQHRQQRAALRGIGGNHAACRFPVIVRLLRHCHSTRRLYEGDHI